MHIKELVKTELEALINHPDETIRLLACELLAKLVVYNLDEEKVPELKIV